MPWPAADILKQHTEDRALKQYCLQYMRSTGSFEYTVNCLRQLEKRALEQIAELGGNEALVAIIRDLSKVYSGGAST